MEKIIDEYPWSAEALAAFRKGNQQRAPDPDHERIVTAIESVMQSHSGYKARRDALSKALSDLSAQDRQP